MGNIVATLNKMKKSFLLLALIFVFVLKMQAQFSTNLPIIKLSITNPIVDTYRQTNMEVIDNANGVNSFADPATFTSNAGVKLRGNVAARSYPKKSYSLESWFGFNVSNNVSILGLPPENDWVLLAAYPDRSLLRNKLALELHDEMDRYAPRLVYCELFIDTTYQGIYLFGEKVKRDSARVDLANLRTIDNFGVELTGGYILNVDDENGSGFVSNFAPPNATASQQFKFLYEYPDNGDITPAQKAYIQSYVDSFESGLNSANFQDPNLGWRPYGANNAFIDYIIVNEVSKNYDAYRIDMYLYKDKSKKMRPGPMWGFDAAFANTANCNANNVAGYAFNLGTSCGAEPNLPAFWWSKLMTDTVFLQDLKCRYTDYRRAGNQLDEAHIFQLIDSFSAYTNAQNAVTRNFAKYPIFGVPVVNEPTPMATNHANEISNIKIFITARLAWLDAQWIDNSCAPDAVNTVSKRNQISIYPNPAHGAIRVTSSSASPMHFSLKNMHGALLKTGDAQKEISTVGLAAGVYILLIDQDEQRYLKKIVVE